MTDSKAGAVQIFLLPQLVDDSDRNKIILKNLNESDPHLNPVSHLLHLFQSTHQQ